MRKFYSIFFIASLWCLHSATFHKTTSESHSIYYVTNKYSYFDNCSFNPVDSFIWFELYGTPSDRDVDLIGSVSNSSSCKTPCLTVMTQCFFHLFILTTIKLEFVNRLYRHGMLWGDWALSIHPTCRFVHHPFCF